MKYKFKCEKCNKEYDLEMSIAEYDDFNKECEKCGEKMTRIYESPQISGVGKSNDSDDATDMTSCTGSCRTCAGCGI